MVVNHIQEALMVVAVEVVLLVLLLLLEQISLLTAGLVVETVLMVHQTIKQTQHKDYVEDNQELVVVEEDHMDLLIQEEEMVVAVLLLFVIKLVI